MCIISELEGIGQSLDDTEGKIANAAQRVKAVNDGPKASRPWRIYAVLITILVVLLVLIIVT